MYLLLKKHKFYLRKFEKCSLVTVFERSRIFLRKSQGTVHNYSEVWSRHVKEKKSERDQPGQKIMVVSKQVEALLTPIMGRLPVSLSFLEFTVSDGCRDRKVLLHQTVCPKLVWGRLAWISRHSYQFILNFEKQLPAQSVVELTTVARTFLLSLWIEKLEYSSCIARKQIDPPEMIFIWGNCM